MVSLFIYNACKGRKTAIVHNTSGVTRDRQESLASLGDLSFTVFWYSDICDIDRFSWWIRLD